MKNIDSDLIRGNIDTIILKTMLDGDKYGLDIIKEVEARSNGTYELKQPTLYSCLKRLENQELISSYWLDSDIGGRRHYYKLTEKGRQFYEQKQEEWSKSKFIIDNLLSNYNSDEYRLVKKDDYDKIIENKTFNYDSSASSTTASKTDFDEDAAEDNYNDDVASEDSYNDDSSSETFEDADEMTEEAQEDLNEVSYESLDNSNFDEPDEFDSDTGLGSDESVDSEALDEAHAYDEGFINLGEDSVEDYLKNYDDIDEETEVDRDSDLVSPVYLREEQKDEVKTEPTLDEHDERDHENNILSMLRSRDNEEINTYYGDKNSYINHLNMDDEKDHEKDDEVVAIQQNLLDDAENQEDSVNTKLSEFEENAKQLLNFNSAGESTEYKDEFDDIPSSDPIEITSASNDYDSNFSFENLETEQTADAETEKIETEAEKQPLEDDFFDDLDSLSNGNASTFVAGDDGSEYLDAEVDEKLANFTESEATQEEQEDEQTDDVQEDVVSDDFQQTEQDETTTDFSAFDNIISHNTDTYSQVDMFNYSEPNFTPSYTSSTYKDRLSDISEYSKNTKSEPVSENIAPSGETISKVKNIQKLKEDFEQEGIAVREYRKILASEEASKSYLLVNKINFVCSLILMVGFLFILTATFIIMNNTGYHDMVEFNFLAFVYGFIPFVALMIYNLIKFLANPYKKVPAKYSARIMIFIALIVTVQLLLITYCVNLQLGFYSFTQASYNHLIWIIPTIISFAPIVSNIIYVSLFYSQNFNV